MKIAVSAANSRSGQEFVRAALIAGHQVRAGIHRSSNMKSTTGLSIIECDATKLVDVIKLIKGQDSVVSFIGHVKYSPPNVQTKATKVIITAMVSSNQKRLVSLTGTGVRFPNDKITLIDRFLNKSIAIIDSKRVADGINHAELLKNSNLDWTIIRVLKLTDGKSRQFSLVTNGPTKLFVSRKEVAQAVLKVIEQGAFIRTAPIISKVIKS